MKAISEAEHKKICEKLERYRTTGSFNVVNLQQKKEELEQAFIAYQKGLNEVKQLIHEYRNCEKALRQEIKRIQLLNPVRTIIA